MSGRKWIDARWHVDGRGIHAGSGMQLRLSDGTWLPIRIETKESGRRLFAHWDPAGPMERFSCISEIRDTDELRWPPEPVRDAWGRTVTDRHANRYELVRDAYGLVPERSTTLQCKCPAPGCPKHRDPSAANDWKGK